MLNVTKDIHILNQYPDDQLFCTKSLARLLSVSTQWLEIGRCKGDGPPFLKLSQPYDPLPRIRGTSMAKQ